MSVSSNSNTVLSLEPIRLVLVPIKCFYCDHSENVYEWLICNLFGLFHCEEHEAAAKRDCEKFMRINGWVRLIDARNHSVIGPFLTALGNHIPVLRSSGAVDTNWFFANMDDAPAIKYSKSTGAWGFNLTNGHADKFVPLADFRNPRVAPVVKEEARGMLDAVEATLTAGVYKA